MKKKAISANLYQKCLILCSKILLNVPHNLSLIVLLPWQHTGFQTSPAFYFHICKWCLIYMIQQAYKYVSLILWPYLTFFELKITYILMLSRWGLEKSEFPWEQNVLEP